MAANQQSIPQDIIKHLEGLGEEHKLWLAKDLNRLRNGVELEEFESDFLNDFFNSENGNYTIQLMGGVNSANFLIKNKGTQESWILQLESKLQKNTSIAEKKIVAKKQIYEKAGKQKEIDFLVPKYYSSGVIDYGGGMFKEIHILQYVEGHDLSKLCSNSELEYDEHLEFVLSYYKQAAKILVKLEKLGICFPDLKGSNLLCNSEGKVVISDVKSMIPAIITAGGHIVVTADFLKEMGIDPTLIGVTPYMVPPELKNGRVQESFDVKKVHAFLLGMSFYIDLTGEDLEKIKQDVKSHDGFKPDYNHEIFSTSKGKHYKGILECLIHQEPNERIDVEEFIALCGEIGYSHFQSFEQKPLEEVGGYLVNSEELSSPMPSSDNSFPSSQSASNFNRSNERFAFFNASRESLKGSRQEESSDGDSYYSYYGNTPIF